MTQKLYIEAANNNITSRPPIWFMRQAGRYLPEYQVLRKKHGFLTMIRTPELATEITLQPIDRFGMDAAILFSDILVVAEALGSKVEFVEKVGPVLSPIIDNPSQLSHLKNTVDEDEFDYVYQAIKCLRKELDTKSSYQQTALIGFAGAPFTVASYMIEGGSSQTLAKTKKWFYNDPDSFKTLLQRITDTTVTYLNGQIKAGVEALQLFDTWASHLNWETFQTFSLKYMNEIISKLDNPNNIPITIFCKGSSVYAPLLFHQSDANVLSIDAQADISKLRETYGGHKALQGNLDPYALYAPQETLSQTVKGILKSMKTEEGYKGYIFNLGHGIFPDIDPNQVQKVVELIHNA